MKDWRVVARRSISRKWNSSSDQTRFEGGDEDHRRRVEEEAQKARVAMQLCTEVDRLHVEELRRDDEQRRWCLGNAA